MKITITEQYRQLVLVTHSRDSENLTPLLRLRQKSRINFNDPKVQAHMKARQEMFATTPLNQIFGDVAIK